MPTMYSDPLGLLRSGRNARNVHGEFRRRLSDCLEGDEDCVQKCLDDYYGESLGWAKSASILTVPGLSGALIASYAQDRLSGHANRNRYTGARNSALGGRYGYATGARQAKLLRFFKGFNYATAVLGAFGAGCYAGAKVTCMVRCSQ